MWADVWSRRDREDDRLMEEEWLRDDPAARRALEEYKLSLQERDFASVNDWLAARVCRKAANQLEPGRVFWTKEGF